MVETSKKGEKPALRRYFFDTEFVDWPQGFEIDFISIGIVPETEGAREYYGVSREFNEASAARVRPWLKDNVLAKLPPMQDRVSVAQIRRDILRYLEPAKEVEFWAKNGTYDNFALCKIFGGMGNMREALKGIGIERVTFRDLNEVLRYAGNREIPAEPAANAHIAIHDARWDRKIYKLLKSPEVY